MLLMGSSPSSWVIETRQTPRLGEAADVELELELAAEEAAEAVHDNDIERRRLGDGRVDHALSGRRSSPADAPGST
jgi:hypothetical protein